MALSPTSSRGGGSSYTAPTSREEWSSNGIAVADTDGAWIPWNNGGSPSVVLDNTIPAHPILATASGVYAVSVVINVGSMSPNGRFEASLHLDRTGFDAGMDAYSSMSALAPANSFVSDISLALVWYVPLGGEVSVFVTNNDGVSSRNFYMPYAHIQRIS